MVIFLFNMGAHSARRLHLVDFFPRHSARSAVWCGGFLPQPAFTPAYS
ncbi:Uncharacterised protein [Vibrio cholerae]|nr:Uncharacterised protein [Vibrio cholerae]CSH87530.1 Uncharacterised protein [Vibrio cholerae]CSI58011.1 Uncharacterised protein [Vibrio cholerae]